MGKKLPEKVKEVLNFKPIEKEGVKTFSYSQLTLFTNCPRQWDLRYGKSYLEQDPTIHLIFGTAMHETIQEYLNILYNHSVNQADSLNLTLILFEKMLKYYKESKDKFGKHFSTEEEILLMVKEGENILDYVKKKRRTYFSRKEIFLAGIEVPIYYEIRSGLFFKGFIDLVFYDSINDIWKLVDIKTSTKGWSKYQKEDSTKTAQLLLYKEYFSKQFNIPIDSIRVEYFIVKRHIPLEAEYSSMQRRVQEYIPPSGKIKRGQALSYVSRFIEETLDEENKYVNKEYFANASKSTCKFCQFKGTDKCREGIL